MVSRGLLVAAFVVACGGAPVRAPAPSSPSPATARAPKRLTPRDMLRGIPASAEMIFVIDVDKLRTSPLAVQGWSMLRDVPQVATLTETTCGVLLDATYALFGLRNDGKEMWAFVRGIRRTATLTCQKAKDEAVATQNKVTTSGDYTLETTINSVTESLWIDADTAYVIHRAAGATPHGEKALRRLMNVGDLDDNREMAALLERIDFDAGLVMIAAGETLKQPTIAAIGVAVEADSEIRASAHVRFTSEDNAAALRDTYKTVFSQLETARLIGAPEVETDGPALSLAATIDKIQFDWWLAFAKGYAADPNAPPPPLPSP